MGKIFIQPSVRHVENGILSLLPDIPNRRVDVDFPRLREHPRLNRERLMRPDGIIPRDSYYRTRDGFWVCALCRIRAAECDDNQQGLNCESSIHVSAVS